MSAGGGPRELWTRGTHSSRAGMAPGFGCSFVTFSGCSFSFPARSAQRWRRWQLHGSAVPVAAVRPREDARWGAAAPPARLLPGTEPPFRALPGCELAASHPSHSTDHPSTARGQEPVELFLWLLLFLWLPGEHEGVPWLSPPAPSLCNQRDRGATSAAPCVSSRPVSPRAPAELWGCSWRWEGRGGPVGLQPLHPQAVPQGKPCFPSKGCNPGLTGLAGGSGPLVVLGVLAGCHQGCQKSCSWAEQQFLPGQDLLPSCWSCDPTVTPVPLRGWAAAGLAVDGDGLGVPTLLSAAPGAALLLGRGWSSTTTMSSLSLAPFT